MRSARNYGECSDRGRFGFGGDEFSEDEAGDGREHEIVERGGEQAVEGAEFYSANPTFEGFGETAQQHRNQSCDNDYINETADHDFAHFSGTEALLGEVNVGLAADDADEGELAGRGRGKYLGRINHGWTQINTDKMGHAYMVLTILP